MPLITQLKIVFAGLFFLISAGCASKAISQAIGDVWLVTITEDGTVLPHKITLGWEHNDRIVWGSNFPLDREIRFDEPSPFGKNSAIYSLPAQKSCDPGAITNKTEHTYTYHIFPKGRGNGFTCGEAIIVITK